MPRKKDDALRAAREKQILDAAKKCFIDSGFHQTSMRQILDAARISSGGAYNYFSSKDDIVKALVEEEGADVELLLERLGDSKDPLTGIGQLVFDAIAYYSRADAVLATEIYAESCRNPTIDTVIRANTEKLTRRLHQTISRGAKSGAITTRHTTTELTEWLLALVDGYVSRLATNPDLDAKKAARMAKQSVLRFLEIRSGTSKERDT